jgi:hypothetical protein
MLKYVFGHLSRHTYVLPTEQLHYFQCNHNGERIAGNIRIADLDLGRLSLVYYPVERPQEVHSIAVTTASRPEMRVHQYDWGYSVNYNDRIVYFHVPQIQSTAPTKTQIEDCEFVTGLVLDESGQHFWLIYNQLRKAFYYLVAEEYGIREALAEVVPGLYVGNRTQFAYYRFPESERLILMGVNYHNIATNNYFDGPGDQVPIRVRLRELIYSAYPGAKLKGGIDEYGVLQDREEWARYAICPYDRYRSMTELVADVRQLDSQEGMTLADASWLVTREVWNTEAWRIWVEEELERELQSVNITGSAPRGSF